MYELILTTNARRDLRRLSTSIREQVLSKLDMLCETCATRKHKALKGKFKGEFSLRVADAYRIIYTFNRQAQTVEVTRIRHRSISYRILAV